MYGRICLFFFLFTITSLQSSNLIPFIPPLFFDSLPEKAISSPFDSLPDETLGHILKNCSDKETVLLVSKRFLSICDQKNFLIHRYEKIVRSVFPIINFDNQYYLLTKVGDELPSQKYSERSLKKLLIGKQNHAVIRLKKELEKECTALACCIRGSAKHNTCYNLVSLKGWGEQECCIAYNIKLSFSPCKNNIVSIKDMYVLASALRSKDCSAIHTWYNQMSSKLRLQDNVIQNDPVWQRLKQLKPVFILNSSIKQSFIWSACNFLYYLYIERLMFHAVYKNFISQSEWRYFYIKSADGLFEPYIAQCVKNILKCYLTNIFGINIVPIIILPVSIFPIGLFHARIPWWIKNLPITFFYPPIYCRT